MTKLGKVFVSLSIYTINRSLKKYKNKNKLKINLLFSPGFGIVYIAKGVQLDIQEKLQQAVNYTLTSNSVPRSRKSAGRSPSSASIKFENEFGTYEVHGACLRQQFYKAKGMPKDDKMPDPQSQRIFMYGDAIHEVEVDIRKRAGIYVADEMSFWNPEHRISGRIDLFNKDPETNEVYGEELKTTNPFTIKKVSSDPGIAHILQCAIYLDWYANSIGYVGRWVLTYVDRAFGEDASHVISLSDGYIVLNGVIDKKMKVSDIYARYDELEEYLEDNVVPEPDYDILYGRDKLIELADQGRLTKTETNKINKGLKVTRGDKSCEYCDFTEHCAANRDSGGFNG
jgi:hypothetical protein